MRMRKSKIKAIDLFSGCGGVSCGLTDAGFEVVAAVEIEQSAVDAYKNYKPLSKVTVLKDDICELAGQEILTAGKIDRNEMYLLAGCPPCQNFSFQNRDNKTKSEVVRKKLLFQFLKVIKDVYPPFVLMENVPGIKSKTKHVDDKGVLQASNKEILDEFLAELQDESRADEERYFVIESILNSADYGVPQLRKRFVLHAVRYDVYKKLVEKGFVFSLPAPTHSGTEKNGLPKWKTVKDAISDLPPIAQGTAYTNDGKIYNHRCAGLTEKNIHRMQIIRKNGGSRMGLPDDLTLDCHKKIRENGTVYGGHQDVYGIMDYDKPSPTMTGGCLCYTKGRYGHPTQDRAISIREAARLQTFPDDFIFGDSLTAAALQIGNAVPVKLVAASAVIIKAAIDVLQR